MISPLTAITSGTSGPTLSTASSLMTKATSLRAAT